MLRHRAWPALASRRQVVPCAGKSSTASSSCRRTRKRSFAARAWRQSQFREVGPAVEQRFKSQGIDVEKVRALRGKQVYQEAFVWRDVAVGGPAKPATVRQLRSVALMEQSQVRKTAGILEDLVGPSSESAIRQGKFGDLVREVVKGLAGEGEQPRPGNARSDATPGEAGDSPQRPSGLNQSAEDIFFKKFGLPIKSPLLRLRPDEFEDRPPTPGEIRDLQLKLARLKDLLEEKVSERNGEKVSLQKDWHWKRKQQESGEFDYVLVYATATEERRHFSLKGDPYDNKWYWIDVEDEWP